MKIKFKKTGNILAVVFIAMLGYSCVSTKTLRIEIPTPPEKSLPSSIQSLALVTQAVDQRFTDSHRDSIQMQFFEQQFNLDTLILDLKMADTTLQVLGELLFESGRYDYVIPQNRFLDQPGNPSTDQPLPWEIVREISETFDADAVLSMDYLNTRVIASYENESFFDPSRGGFYAAVVARMRIYYEALFRVYDPENETILVREFMRDTLYWEAADVTARNLFSRFTPVKQALVEAGISIALDMSDKISVIWRTDERTYFARGNALMEEASQYARQGNWQTAIKLWKEVNESTRSKSMKSKAQLNIALGYEMLGSLDESVSWALKSYDTMYRPLTYEYLQILNRRKRELKNP